MKTIENQGFLTAPHGMGWSVPAKTPAEFENVNEINGFVHDSYGTALKSIHISNSMPFNNFGTTAMKCEQKEASDFTVSGASEGVKELHCVRPPKSS